MSSKKFVKTTTSSRSQKKIQGGIERFVRPQKAEALFQSKDGLKQGKIDAFMVNLRKNNPKHASINLHGDSSCHPSKRRKVTSTTSSETTSSIENVNTCKQPENLEVTEIKDDSDSDSYYTAPNTQDSDLNNVYEEPKEFDLCQVTSDNLITSSPILSKHPTKKCKISKILSPAADSLKPDTILELSDDSKHQMSRKVSESEQLAVHNSAAVELPKNSARTPEFSHNEKLCPSEHNHQCGMASNAKEDIFEVTLETLNSATSNCDQIMKSPDTAKELHISSKCAERYTSAFDTMRFKAISSSSQLTQNGLLFRNVELKNNTMTLKLILKDDWVDLNIESGDVVNFLTEDHEKSFQSGEIVQVDSKENLLVLHPDLLINGTTVSNGLGCLRRAVLSERFRNNDFVDCENVTNVMLVGTIVHTIFQKALTHERPMKYDELVKLSHDIVFDRVYLQDMLAVCSSQDEIFKAVELFLHRMENWMAEYFHKKLSSSFGNLSMRHPQVDPKQNKMLKYPANVALTQVVDIEENIWSPRYGMKGKIDVTGKFKIRNQTTKKEAEAILPIEIKTGRDSSSMEHHIQVAIYSLFCDERRNGMLSSPGTLPAGLLLYLKSGRMSCEPLSSTDKCGVLSLRNKIADYLVKEITEACDTSGQPLYSPSNFPEPTPNTRICAHCSQLRNCALIYKSVESERPSYELRDELRSLMIQHLSHLNDDDLAYFKHWLTCVLLENRETTRKEKQLRFWLRSPSERRNEGLCITGLQLAGVCVKNKTNARRLQTFKRNMSQNPNRASFEVGENVIISGAEPAFIAVATGTIHKINENFITVETERDFSGYPLDMLYTFDRYIWMSRTAMQSSLSNLSLLMTDNRHCNKLRSLVISHKEPTFLSSLDFIQRSSKNAVAAMLRGLNRTQRQAIKRVLLCNDYTLVVGMPGSGKTTTIVAMIRILLLCGLRVLVTSYTHSAVDNLLIKLIKYKTKFLRLGRSSRVHPSIQPFTEEYLSRDFKNPDQLKNLYNSARVVGCTCLAVTSHVFFAVPGQSRPIFDVCIVDEASQISQATCLSPLTHSQRFVLVGDHQQLPPLVVSQEARSMGADESLFRRLTRHNAALCELTLQYRMNSQIMGLSNHVTYEGRLECAHESVAKATVQLSRLKNVEDEIGSSADWLVTCLKEKTSLLFMDTSHAPGFEEDSSTNKMEASLLVKITQYLVKAGCKPTDIGVIAPYRKQVQLLEDEIYKVAPSSVEVNTVDKYQGRDKSVILLSFVKSSTGGVEEKKGELLSDWRRLNVAITRAKHKLIMVGNVESLMHYEPCKKMLDYLRLNNLIQTI